MIGNNQQFMHNNEPSKDSLEGFFEPCVCDLLAKMPGVVAWSCSSRYCKNRNPILNDKYWQSA